MMRVDAERSFHIRVPHLCLKYGDWHGRLCEFGRRAVTKRVQACSVVDPELPREGLQRALHNRIAFARVSIEQSSELPASRSDTL